MQWTDITPKQHQELLKLNERLRLLQKKYINEAVKIDKELKKRVDDPEDLLYDYEIDYKLDFYLKDDDPEYKLDDDNVIVSIKKPLLSGLKHISENSNAHEFPWSDEDNHNERIYLKLKDNPMKDDKHCYWFCKLYDVYETPLQEMLKIGSIWCDLVVRYQYLDDEIGDE